MPQPQQPTTVTTAKVLADLISLFLGSCEEQVEPSNDSQRYLFPRKEFEVRVLKKGVTGMGPEKLLYDRFRDVRLVKRLIIVIFPLSILCERPSAIVTN